MTTLIVLFNLKSDEDKAAYEAWAKSTDLPTVRSLNSCHSFEAYQTTGLFGKDQSAPYQYVEKIDITDTTEFVEEIKKTEAMKDIAAQFQTFADNPMFMVCENIEAS